VIYLLGLFTAGAISPFSALFLSFYILGENAGITDLNMPVLTRNVGRGIVSQRGWYGCCHGGGRTSMPAKAAPATAPQTVALLNCLCWRDPFAT